MPPKIIKYFLLVFLVTSAQCWQYFTTVHDLKLQHSPIDLQTLHSEYMFGDCRRPDKTFYTHVYQDHIDIVGRMVIRGWINVIRIPTCIVLRAMSYPEDTFRETAYEFQICCPRITYSHSQKRYKYYYFEWFIPKDYSGGMNYHILFFGPPRIDWQ